MAFSCNFAAKIPKSGATGFYRVFPALAGNGLFIMVGDTGIEPVTPSMSTKCSTAELIALTFANYARIKIRFPQNKMGRGSPRRFEAL